MSRKLINLALFRGDEVIQVNKVLTGYNTLDDLLSVFNNTRSIYDCYEKPSRFKVGIYNDWKGMVEEHDRNMGYNTKVTSRCFTVSSYNCMQFTLSALVVLPHYAHNDVGRVYSLCVTKCNSFLYPTKFLSDGTIEHPTYTEYVYLSKLYSY